MTLLPTFPELRDDGQGSLSKRIFWITFVFVASLSTLWSLGSPVFSVPDESAHTVKAIAQVRGELIGHPRAGSRQLVVDLPAQYSYKPNILCFVNNSKRAADCGDELGEPSGTLWAATQVSAYNPIYYYVVGWPSLFTAGNVGVYAMRIASSLFSALFIAWGLQAAMASRRARWMPVGAAFVVTPMIIYLAGAINPNGIEVAAAFSLWLGLLRLLERHGSPSIDRSTGHLWLIVTLSGIMLANARSLGPLWVVVVVSLCSISSGRRSVVALFRVRRSYWWIGVLAIGGVFSIVWTLGGGSLSGQAQKSDAPLVGSSFLSGVAYMIRMTPRFLEESIGVFGWQDTYLPGAVLWLMVAALALFAGLAFVSLPRRQAALVLLVCLVSLAVPVLVQGYSVRQTGIIWQGRYALFLYIGIPIVSAFLLSTRAAAKSDFLLPRLAPLVLGLLWAYGSAAFFFVLRRYVIGTALPVGAMFKDPQWQPPLGWIALMALFVFVSAGFSVWLWRLSLVVAMVDDSERVRERGVKLSTIGSLA